MKKHLYSASLILTACLLTGCESDGGRMRQGIQDPINVHEKHSWKIWPFRDSRDPKTKLPPATEGVGSLPEY